MKKKQVSKKFIKENYKNIISVNYCNLQYLLKDIQADFFSAGVHGWSCDHYILDGGNLVISTGYKPIGKEINQDFIDSFNNQAEQLETPKEKTELLKIFTNRILKEFF